MPNQLVRQFGKDNEPLARLKPVLGTMADIFDRYITQFHQIFRGEVPYYYGERTTLSQFVGAVWQSNSLNLVLEECKSEKVCDAGKYNGRDDIWFCVDQSFYYGEAKQGDLELADTKPDMSGWILQARTECDAAHKNSEQARKERWVQFPVGLYFNYLWCDECDAKEFKSRFDSLAVWLAQVVETFSNANPFDVLVGAYYRDDLTHAGNACVWKSKSRVFPALISLVCMKSDVRY